MLVRVTIEIWKKKCLLKFDLSQMFDVYVRSGFQLARTTAVNIALNIAAFAASFAQLAARSLASHGNLPWSFDKPGASCTNTTAHTQTQSDGGMCGITWCAINAFGGVVLCVLLWRTRSLRPDRKWGNIWDGLRECDEAPKWKSCQVWNSGRAAGYISRFGASVLRHHVVGVMAVDLLVLRLAQHGKQAAFFPAIFVCEIGGRVLFF